MVDAITIDRRENENDFEYHKRLIKGKLVDKTLADVDYSELAEAVYGQEYSSDVARRMMYGSNRTIDLLEKNQCGGSSCTDDISGRIEDLRRERQRFFDQRREYTKLISEEGRLQHLFEVTEHAAMKLNETVGVLYNRGQYDLSLARFNDVDAVLFFGDWHYGMKTDNIYNKYNIDICKTRVKNVVDNAIERIQTHGCKNLHIVIVGDLVHGAIHTSARVASEELVSDQIMQVSEVLAQSICELSKFVENTYVYMTYGNHARVIQNKSDSIHRDNFERLIPWWLKLRLQKCENVFVAPEFEHEFITINVMGHDICAAHGDLDSVKEAAGTIGPLFYKKYGKDIEYIVLGDKHHRESFDGLGITTRICGSLCGVDDYANDKRLYSNPSQLMFTVDANGVDAEYALRCD